MIEKSKRRRIGTLIRTLLDIDINTQAKILNVAPNTIYGYESCKFNSKHIEDWYNIYYEKLNIKEILIKVGTFKLFNKIEDD